ncbi:MAG TPA: hypothetical protein DCZ40_02350 [Lachnospiraceae bacterium]|nr:hypothetical protein [Lachnospiraceae bacterium]
MWKSNFIREKFCSKCGNPVVTPNWSENKDIAAVQIIVCPKCNSVIKPGKKFCSAC